MHSEKQRNVMMRRIEKEEEEERKFSFQPQIFSSPKRATSRDTSKDVHERLIEWNNDKKKKIEAKMQEKIEAENTMHNTLDLPTKKRNESMSRDETIDSIPAYQRLYKENESKKARKELLEKRVLREIGASFAPKINQRNLSARKSPNNSNGTRYKSLIDNSPCNNYKANVSGAVDDDKVKTQRQKNSTPLNFFSQVKNESDNGPLTKRMTFLESLQNNMGPSVETKTATFGTNS